MKHNWTEMNESERRSEGGRVVTEITFTAVKVPRQSPLVLPVKVGRWKGKAFGSADGRAAWS
jgi:hypothetical protein